MCLCRWFLLVTFLASSSHLLLGQTSEWAVVTQLTPGQKVKVLTVDGKSYTGKVHSVSENAIQVGKSDLISRPDVRAVQIWSPGYHGRNALVGLAIGAGIGAGLGAGACGGRDAFVSRGECVAVGIPFFGGLGTGVGVLLPSSGKWHEVYRIK